MHDHLKRMLLRKSESISTPEVAKQLLESSPSDPPEVAVLRRSLITSFQGDMRMLEFQLGLRAPNWD